MRPRISIRGFVCPSVRQSVGPSVGQSVGWSVTRFFGHSKNGGKWSKMTFHFSTGFFFQSLTLNLSFDIPHNLAFIILLSKSSITISLTILHKYNFFFIVIPSQSLFHNYSFTISLSQYFFHNLSQS